MTLRKNMAMASLVSLLSTPVMAQNNEWQFEGSLYLFAAETDVSVGDRSVTLSFSDALENLDVAGMAAFKATNNQWTFVGDLMYFDLGFENDVSSQPNASLEIDQKNTIFTGYALYRVYENSNTILDLGGGFRYFQTDTNLTLNDGLASSQRGTDDSWADLILAAHARFDLSEKWSSMIGVDYGSFHDDRTTYGATVTLDYAFTENWVGRVGYRYINIEDDGRDFDFRFEQSGAIFGVSYRY